MASPYHSQPLGSPGFREKPDNPDIKEYIKQFEEDFLPLFKKNLSMMISETNSQNDKALVSDFLEKFQTYLTGVINELPETENQQKLSIISNINKLKRQRAGQSSGTFRKRKKQRRS